jgi:hypothetical protein
VGEGGFASLSDVAQALPETSAQIAAVKLGML